MIKRYRLTTRYAVFAVALLLAATSISQAFAQGAEAFKIRLEVTDGGYVCVEGCDAVQFGDTQWEPVLEIEQGRLVELTFVFAHLDYVAEEHVMVLEGYKLEWDQIDFHNREATLQFIADQPGTFIFKCDVDCEVHDYMQRGHLKVTRGGSGAAEYTPTILTLSPSF